MIFILSFEIDIKTMLFFHLQKSEAKQQLCYFWPISPQNQESVKSTQSYHNLVIFADPSKPRYCWTFVIARHLAEKILNCTQICVIFDMLWSMWLRECVNCWFQISLKTVLWMWMWSLGCQWIYSPWWPRLSSVNGPFGGPPPPSPLDDSCCHLTGQSPR